MLGLRTAIGWMLDWGLGLTKKEVFIAARQLAHRAGRRFNGPEGLPSDFGGAPSNINILQERGKTHNHEDSSPMAQSHVDV